MKVFITGDRSAQPQHATIAATQVVLGLGLECALHGDVLELFTGDNTGIESGVRHIASSLRTLVEVIPTENGDTSSADWDARHKLVAETCDKVIVIHGEIFNSRMAASAVRVIPPEKLMLIGS